MRWFHVSLLNHVTSSYAITGTGMRRSLGNRVTQWAHPEMGLEETPTGASPMGKLGTLDHLSLNTIMASLRAENHHGGSNLTIVEIMTLIDRGVHIQQAPHRSVSERQTAGWKFGKTQEDANFKITGETPTTMKLGGVLCRKIDQTP